MIVRRAMDADVDAVVQLGEAAHADSTHSSIPFSDFYARQAFFRMVSRSDSTLLLLCDDTTVHGIMAGYLEPAYFCAQYDAVETLLYVDPTKRTAKNVRLLIKAFEQWAASNGAAGVQLGVTQLGRAERLSALYGRMGYGINAFVHRRAL